MKSIFGYCSRSLMQVCIYYLPSPTLLHPPPPSSTLKFLMKIIKVSVTHSNSVYGALNPLTPWWWWWCCINKDFLISQFDWSIILINCSSWPVTGWGVHGLNDSKDELLSVYGWFWRVKYHVSQKLDSRIEGLRMKLRSVWPSYISHISLVSYTLVD